MSLLQLVEKDEAAGKVAEIYEIMNNTIGFIPNAFKVYSPSEHILENQFGNLAYFMRHKTLGGKMLALIRLLVSEQEQCKYCIGVNTGILFQYGILPEAIEGIRRDPASAPLDPKELAMLLFVLKMVRNSNSIEKQDVENLKGLCWNDQDILEASYHGATQVAADKIFNAFKIEPDM